MLFHTSLRRLVLTVVAFLGIVGGLLAGALSGTAQAATTTGTVATNGVVLNVRSGPSASTVRRATLPDRSKVTLVCQVAGQKIWGKVRTTNMWNRLPNGRYVSDAYIARTSTPPVCPPEPLGRLLPPKEMPVVRTWVAPLPGVVGSGFRTAARPTHDGVDFPAERNTPVRAASAGTVLTAECNVSKGTCDEDGSPAVRGCGWYVEIAHPDQVVTRYCHLVREPAVRVGQQVVAGQVIGHVGTSGNSTGPHLHFEIHTEAPPADKTNAVEPVAFLKARGVVVATR